MNARHLPWSILFAGLAACSGTADESVDDAPTDDGALSVANLSELEVLQSEGFAPPLPAGQCRPSTGHWTVDFTTGHVTGKACVGGLTREMDRDLATDELADVKRAVAALRTGQRPATCATDTDTTSLTLTRGALVTRYADEPAACRGTGLKPVTAASLQPLVERLRRLADPVLQQR